MLHMYAFSFVLFHYLNDSGTRSYFMIIWKNYMFVFLKSQSCFTTEVTGFSFAWSSLALRFSCIHVTLPSRVEHSHAHCICLFFKRRWCVWLMGVPVLVGAVWSCRLCINYALVFCSARATIRLVQKKKRCFGADARWLNGQIWTVLTRRVPAELVKHRMERASTELTGHLSIPSHRSLPKHVMTKGVPHSEPGQGLAAYLQWNCSHLLVQR